MSASNPCFQKTGTVNVDKNKGEGRILFTDSFFFALRSKNQGEKAGMHFGLLGILIGRWIDARKAKAAAPQYLGHPELAVLPEKVRKELQKTELLGFMPLGEGFAVTQKFSGFVFTAPDCPTVVYKGFFNKGGIRKYLGKRNIPVVKQGKNGG